MSISGAGGGRRPETLVVAIDGPAGSGKSTVARLLAQRLEVPYLDTGAMYRALALHVLERGVDPADRQEVARLAAATSIELTADRSETPEILVEGQRVGDRIRAPEVGEASSAIAAYSEVRSRMVELQRRWALERGGVIEGRDIGTVVFPEAPFKFFLDARPEVRAERRLAQLGQEGRSVEREAVLAALRRRDARDRERTVSPLRADASYTVVDSSDRSVEEIVEMVVRVVQQRTGASTESVTRADPKA